MFVQNHFSTKVLCLFMLAMVITGNLHSQINFYYPVYSQERNQFSEDAIYFVTDNDELVKSDYSGNMIWSKTIPDTWDWSAGEDKIFILSVGDLLSCLDTSGNVIWTKDVSASICGSGNNFRAITTSGDRILLHWLYSVNQDALLVLDTAGNYVNAWCDLSFIVDFEIASIYPVSNGNFWVQLIDGPGNGNFVVFAELDHDGNQMATAPVHYFNICFDDYIDDLISFSDSSSLIIDNGNDFTSFFQTNCGIFKMDHEGNLLHQKVFGSNNDTLFQVARAGIDSSDNIFLILFYIADSSGFILMKLDSAFNIISTNEWEGSGQQFSMEHYDRMQIHNGFFCCPAHYFYNYPIVYQSFIRIDTLSVPTCGALLTPRLVREKFYQLNQTLWDTVFTTSTSISISSINIGIGSISLSGDLCSALTVHEIYEETGFNFFPNPAKEKMEISFQDNGKNEVQIFKSDGSEVINLTNISTGYIIYTADFPAGIYLLKYQSEKYSFVKKIVKL